MAVNKVTVNGKTVFDLTGVTVTPETLAKGVTAHDKSGAQITGTAEASSSENATFYSVDTYSDSENLSLSMGKSVGNNFADPDVIHGYKIDDQTALTISSGLAILQISGIGLHHGYFSGGTFTGHYLTQYYKSSTWYKLVKMPAASAPNKDITFYGTCDGNYHTSAEDVSLLWKIAFKFSTDSYIYFSPKNVNSNSSMGYVEQYMPIYKFGYVKGVAIYEV